MRPRVIVFILYWLSALLPLAIVCLFIPILPDQVAVHYNASGAADRWGPTLELFIPGIISLVVATLVYLSVISTAATFGITISSTQSIRPARSSVPNGRPTPSGSFAVRGCPQRQKRYARPNSMPAACTTNATIHATPHCMHTTAKAILPPSSLRTAEIAATHGV